jgi:hypothetical protein
MKYGNLSDFIHWENGINSDTCLILQSIRKLKLCSVGKLDICTLNWIMKNVMPPSLTFF